MKLKFSILMFLFAFLFIQVNADNTNVQIKKDTVIKKADWKAIADSAAVVYARYKTDTGYYNSQARADKKELQVVTSKQSTWYEKILALMTIIASIWAVVVRLYPSVNPGCYKGLFNLIFSFLPDRKAGGGTH